MRPDPGLQAIETGRLRLRRSVPADAEAISAYRSIPEVGRFQGWERTDPAFLRREFELMAERQPGRGGWVQLTVEERDTGELVGDVGMSPAEGEDGVLKIGYTIAPEHQRKGYATEAVTALIGYAFETLGAAVVRIHADAENLASIRVAEKAGLTLVERYRRRDAEGVWFGVRYELARSDLPAGRGDEAAVPEPR